MDQIVNGINKSYGTDVLGSGVTWNESDRIPTGWFPFDLATGGGFPMGGTSVVFGPESSCKTSVALRAIAMCQLLKPQLRCVFLDLEGAYEPDWGAALGVDNDKLVYALPDYAEQVVDIVCALLEAQDMGIVVIDSLAAMSPENEVISDASKASVGSAGLIISKFYRKMTSAINQAKREGRYPLVIAINQIRHKVGVMYGSPETQPGGWAFKYASKMTVRLYGKEKEDAKISPQVPPFKEVNGVIKKWKVPIAARSFKFDMQTLTIPEHGLQMGQVDAWTTLSTYLKKFDMLTQEKSGKPWVLNGEEYKTQSVLRERLQIELDFRADIERQVIDAAMHRSALSAQ